MTAGGPTLRQRLASALDVIEDGRTPAGSLLELARALLDEGRVDEAEALAHEAFVRCSIDRPRGPTKLLHQSQAVLAEILVMRHAISLAGPLVVEVLNSKHLDGHARLRASLALMRLYALTGADQLFARERRIAQRSAARCKTTKLYEDALAAIPSASTPVPASFAVALEHELLEVWPQVVSHPTPALQQAIVEALTPAQLAAAIVDTPTMLPRLGLVYHHGTWLRGLADFHWSLSSLPRRELALALAQRCLERDVHDTHLCSLAVYCLARVLDAGELLAPEYDILVWRAMADEMGRREFGGVERCVIDPQTGQQRVVSRTRNYEWWIHSVAPKLPAERLETILCHASAAVHEHDEHTRVRAVWRLLPGVRSDRAAARAVDLVDAWSRHVDEACARNVLWSLRACLLEPLTRRARARNVGELASPLQSTLEALDGPEVLEFWRAEFLAAGKAPKDALAPAIGARVAALHDNEGEALVAIEALFCSKRWGRSGRQLAVEALAGRPCTVSSKALAERLANTKKLDANTRLALQRIAQRLPASPRFAAGEVEPAIAHVSALVAREADDDTLDRRPTRESWIEVVQVIESCDESLRAELIAKAKPALEAWPACVRALAEEWRDVVRADGPLHCAPLIRTLDLSQGFAGVRHWQSLLDKGYFTQLDTLALNGLELDKESFDLLLDAEVFRGIRRLELAHAFADPSYMLRLLSSGQLEQCRALQIDLGEDQTQLIDALASMPSLVELSLVGRDGDVELERGGLERLLDARPLEGLVLWKLTLGAGTCALLGANEALQRLQLSHCQLSDAHVLALCSGAGLGRLACLDLSNNRLTGAALVAITATASGLHGLHRLRLAATGLDAADLQRWAAAPGQRAQLRELALSSCSLGRDGARSLFATPWPVLETLALDKSRLTDEGAMALSSQPTPIPLVVLSLANSGVSGRGLEALMSSPHISRLRRFDFTANRIDSAAGADALAKLAASPLEELYLADCHLHERYQGMVEALGGTVHTLHVYENGIGTAGLCAIASSPTCAALRWLYLDSYDLSRRALRFLASSPYLSEEIKRTWRRTQRWCEAAGPGSRYPAYHEWP